MSIQYPRRPKVQLGGIAHFGRIIARFDSDRYLLDFLELDTSAFEQRVREASGASLGSPAHHYLGRHDRA